MSSDSTEPGVELSVPTLSDVSITYTWQIRKYARSVGKRDGFDSPAFEHNANGVRTRWNVSVRFWRGPDGRRVRTPAVLCLNLLACAMHGQAQARVRFSFGAYNASARRWETSPPSLVALNLSPTDQLLSVGHRDVSLLPRHASRRGGDVTLRVTLCVAPTDDPTPSLSRDLALLLGTGDVALRCDTGEELRAHSVLLRARSPAWADMLDRSSDATLPVGDVTPAVLLDVLRYVYTDRVEDATCPALLAASHRFDLPGLQALCERSLLDSVAPGNLPSLLLLADRCGCDALKRSLLDYCEDNVSIVGKSVAWRAMELVNPELFVEVCEEAGLGSSLSSDLDSDSGIAGL